MLIFTLTFIACGDSDPCIHIPGLPATCTAAQTCTECGVVLESALPHTFGANWEPTADATWCVGGAHGNGTETDTCSNCTATNGTRLTPCLGTQALNISGGIVGDNAELNVAHVCIPDSRGGVNVTSISDHAFALNHNIQSIRIGEKVITIEDCAFYSVYISIITLPASITNIGKQAFENCLLETIIMLPVNPPILGDGDVFVENPLEDIFVPAGSVDAYKEAYKDIWGGYMASLIKPIP